MKAYDEVILQFQLFLVSAVDGSEWVDSHSDLFNLKKEISMPTEYEGLKFSKYEWIIKLAYSSDVCRNRSYEYSAQALIRQWLSSQRVYSFKISYVCRSEKYEQSETASSSMLT